MHRIFVISIVSVAGLSAACDRSAGGARDAHADSVAAVVADSVARARQDSINRAQPGYVIDSLLPVEEEIRRFRAAIGGETVVQLQHASPSRDSLIARFAAALEHSDTVDLRNMALSAREFIDLYYPESQYTHAPYRQAPRLVWGFGEMGSSTGLTRLLGRHGGKHLNVTGVTCDATANKQGRNLLWTSCELTLGGGGGQQHERLFGSIIERDGRFKFMSYANQY